MANVKSQVTVFIIIGIVVLLVVLFGSIVVKLVSEEKINGQYDTEPIKNFVESCIEKTGRNAISFTALRGGYYNTPNPKELYSSVRIPLYWEVNESKVPDRETVENEVFLYIKENLPGCLEDFADFDEYGFQLDAGEINGNVIIAEEKTSFELDYPLTISRENYVFHSDEFFAKTDIGYYKIYQLAEKIIQEQKKNPDSFPVGFVTDLAFENDFIFETMNLDDNTVLLVLIFDQHINHKRQPLVYSFISRYNWTDLGPSGSVSIEPIPRFVINESKNFNYNVNAAGDNITFSAYTELFDINPNTGEINFDTSYIPSGERIILIKAEDERGNRDFAHMHLTFDFENLLPVIEPIGNLSAYVGEKFTYNITATDPSDEFVYFVDDTSLFDVDTESGEIEFTPSIVGNYSIKITAVNSEGYVHEYMELEVK